MVDDILTTLVEIIHNRMISAQFVEMLNTSSSFSQDFFNMMILFYKGKAVAIQNRCKNDYVNILNEKAVLK